MLVRFTCERPAACPNFFWAGPALIFSHQVRPSSKLKLSSATSIWSLRSAHAYKHHASAHDQMKEKIQDKKIFEQKLKFSKKAHRYTRNYLFSPLIDSIILHSRMNSGQPRGHYLIPDDTFIDTVFPLI